MQPNRSNSNQSSQSNIKYETPTNVVSDNDNNTPISSISSITNSIRPHINSSNNIINSNNKIQQSNSSGNLVTLPTVQPKIKPLDSEDLEQQQRKQQYKGSAGFVPHQNDNNISNTDINNEKVVNGDVENITNDVRNLNINNQDQNQNQNQNKAYDKYKFNNNNNRYNNNSR
eukprot:942567_1